MRRIDEQTKEKVIYMYQDGCSYDEIIEATGCAAGSVANIAAGLPTRKTVNKKKHCDFCGAEISLKGAKFCPYCGKSVLTKKEKLIADVRSLYQYQSLMNERSRDEYKERVDNIIEQLKKAEVK